MKSLTHRLKQLIRISLVTSFSVALSGILFEIMAQTPPMLPGSPDQAPLGGLAVLAGAGGLYAVKKLRDRQNQ